MARLLLLRAHGDRGKRAEGRIFLCSGERNRFPIPEGALAVDSESVSPRLASARGDPYVGGSDAGIWRVVKTRCFAPEEGWTRHPQVGNCGTPDETSAFTQVNFRCVNKIRLRWVTAISNDEVCLRQVAESVESRKRVEAQELPVN